MRVEENDRRDGVSVFDSWSTNYWLVLVVKVGLVIVFCLMAFLIVKNLVLLSAGIVVASKVKPPRPVGTRPLRPAGTNA